MNYQNIENEIKKYSDFFKLSQNSIFKLSNYYKEISKQGIKFINKIKQSLDAFYLDILKEDRTTTYNKLLINIYNEKKDFIEKIKIFFSNIDKNYGDKLAEYEKDYKKKGKDLIYKITKMNEDLTKGKIQLDKWKNQYFEYCKYSIDLEKKIKSLENQNEKKDALNKLNSQLNTNEELKEIKKKNYEREKNNLNKQLIFYENDYYNIKNTIENEDVEKMQFVINVIKDSNQNNILFMKDFNDHLNKIEILKNKLNARNDWKKLRKEFNFNVEEDINKEKRFLLEEFLDYDTFKKEEEIKNKNNIINLNNNLDNNFQQNNNNKKILITKENEDKVIRTKKILNIGKLFFIDLEHLNEKEQEINNIIKNLISSDNKIDNLDFLKIINFVENNGQNCKIFVDILATHFCKDQFISIKNFDNFYNLINISVFILNYIFDQKDFFDICFLILFISEKSAYLGPAKDQSPIPIYFFEIISKKTIFNSMTFWKDLIDAKIDMVSQLDMNKEYNKRMKNTINKNKIFGNIFNKNENLEGELMLKQIFREKVGIYFTEVFYSFLKHFTHFNYYKQEEMLNYYNSKYNLDEITINYFKLVIKSDNIFNNEKKLTKNINPLNKTLFEYKPNKSFKKIDNKAIKCIIFSLKYLSIKEYIPLLCLNKKYYKQVSNTIYKQFLLKNENIDIKTHLMIWKIILNYSEIKKEFIYNKIVESNNDKNKKIINEQIIIMDIGRTRFRTNKEENKLKLLNILKAISSEFPNTNYYQGMNQVAAFLLHICDYNEEEAFYLFACILKHTNYSSIFLNNLEKMNYLFYQFDHLLNLYLPGIYIYFKQSSINATFFLSSWIITLCTNFFDDSGEKNNAKSIMMIWDLFFFSGWKIFMTVGLIILKQREKEILENFSEGLLPLLTGNLIKSEIIDSDHFEELRDEFLKNKFNIKTELFENIGEEYNIKKDIEFFKEGNKINCTF